MIDTEPLLSVVVLAYNHEKYIRQALDSILMQRVTFSLEILVGDDASSDGTPDILREYNEKYPGLFTMVLRRSNLGPSKNDYDLNLRAKGKYIAHLEGDDYWTDPYKLQKQIDFLEEHPEYSACTHLYSLVDENGRLKPNQRLWSQSDKDLYEIQDYKSGKLPGQTATLVNINFFLLGNHDYSAYGDSLIPDRFYLLCLLANGPIVKLQDNMSCYRYLPMSGQSFGAQVMSNFALRYDYYQWRFSLETYASKELGLVLDLHKEKEMLFNNAIRAFYSKPNLCNAKILLKICKKRPHPTQAVIKVAWEGVKQGLKCAAKGIGKIFGVPKAVYKKIRNRHHAYLIELLKNANALSRSELDVARNVRYIVRESTRQLQTELDLIREQNELLIRALYEQFGSEILAQKLREIRNETDLQENADNEQDMKSEIPSILDRFTSQKVPEYDDCAENGETKMPIASCQGEQLLHNCGRGGAMD